MIVFHICFVNRHQIASLSLDFVMDFLCTSQNRFTCCLIFWIKRTHTHREAVQLWKGKLVSLRFAAWKILAGGWPLQPARTIAPVFACILEIGQSGGAYTVDARRFFLATKEGMPFGCCHMLCFERRTCRFYMLYGLWTLSCVELWNFRVEELVEWPVMTWWLQEIMCKSMAFLWPPCNLTLQDPGGQRLHGGFRDPGAVGTSWTVEGMAAEIGGWGLGDVGGVWIYGDFMVT